ncbi:MAG: Adaptive-response sensory-kinase SasA [Anaerolineales bacterium]|nr:Adaptive-response sensory-kinase SasA [Anaerolineales bacterium]
MIEFFRRHLGARLLLSYLVIIVVGVLVLVIASQFILPTSFNRHMNGMMDGGMGMGMGMNNSMGQLYVDFRASFNEALMYATLAAMLAAFILSLFFSRSVIAPIQSMSLATQRIADGRYDERVQVQGNDELAQLAVYFNQMAEKLNEVETMRRRLIGDVSHELRTPLTAIKGSMEGLMDGILPASEETYQQVHAEAERLNRLVNDLQELSRVEARAYQLEVRPVDVSTLVRTVTRRLSPHAESKRILPDFELTPNLPLVLADEDRAVQVLTNLTGNALQYTSEGGRVTISAKRINHEIQFSIRDTGIGIPPEHLSHIFDRFYRVDKSRSRQAGGGSGIGLTIARALVEAHGGRIWVESAGEGQGSLFAFTLPIEKK